MDNIFDNMPSDLTSEAFSNLLKTDAIKIERIISKGHKSPESGWYNQQQNEWLMLIKGRAVLTFEDQSERKLEAGDYLNIPAHQKHKVSWTDPDIETVWLTVHY